LVTLVAQRSAQSSAGERARARASEAPKLANFEAKNCRPDDAERATAAVSRATAMPTAAALRGRI